MDDAVARSCAAAIARVASSSVLGSPELMGPEHRARRTARRDAVGWNGAEVDSTSGAIAASELASIRKMDVRSPP